MALYRNIFLRKILELDKLVFDVTIHYFERNVEFQLILVDVFKQVIVYWAKFTSKWNIYILKEELYFKKGIRQKWLYSESQAFACFSEKSNNWRDCHCFCGKKSASHSFRKTAIKNYQFGGRRKGITQSILLRVNIKCTGVYIEHNFL